MVCSVNSLIPPHKISGFFKSQRASSLVISFHLCQSGPLCRTAALVPTGMKALGLWISATARYHCFLSLSGCPALQGGRQESFLWSGMRRGLGGHCGCSVLSFRDCRRTGGLSQLHAACGTSGKYRNGLFPYCCLQVLTSPCNLLFKKLWYNSRI